MIKVALQYARYALTTLAILVFLLATPGITGVQWKSALIVSLALAMSSSAIALPMLQERGVPAKDSSIY